MESHKNTAAYVEFEKAVFSVKDYIIAFFYKKVR